MAAAKQKTLVALGVTAALAAVVAAIAQARAAGRADVVVTVRTDALRGCLLGGPLAPNEARLERLRRIEIGQPPSDDADELGSHWPLRCEANAEALARALRDGPPGYLRGSRGRLLTLTEGLFAAEAGSERTIAELAARLDAWEAQIVAAGLPSADPDAELEPSAITFRRPELAAPLPLASVRLGGSSQYGHAGLVLRANDAAHAVIVDGRTNTARVLGLADGALPPFTASGDAPGLFLPRAGKSGLSLVDDRGTPLWPGPGVVFAHATATGGSYVACDEKDGCRLVSVVRRGDAYAERDDVSLPRDQTHALVNGVLVSREKREDPETLFVSLPDQPAQPRSALHPALEPWLRLRACRTPTRTVLAVQGVERTTFFFHDGNSWSEGQAAKAPDFDTIGGPQAQLGCDEEGASIASREGDGLALLRCTPRGCARSVTRALPGARDLAFVGIGDKLFTARVTQGAGGYHPTRSVWARFGTPEGLHTNESLLLGDDAHGGHTVGWIGAYPVANGAVLALSAVGNLAPGTFLIAIDREGRPTKISFD